MIGSRITYVYRDASNYKFRGELQLIGTFDPEAIKRALFDGEFFIPERIGVPSLVPDLRNDDDHSLHYFEEVEIEDVPETARSAKEFADRIVRESKTGWF